MSGHHYASEIVLHASAATLDRNPSREWHILKTLIEPVIFSLHVQSLYVSTRATPRIVGMGWRRGYLSASQMLYPRCLYIVCQCRSVKNALAWPSPDVKGQNVAPCQDRTGDLQIMRLTLYQLSQRSHVHNCTPSHLDTPTLFITTWLYVHMTQHKHSITHPRAGLYTRMTLKPHGPRYRTISQPGHLQRSSWLGLALALRECGHSLFKLLSSHTRVSSDAMPYRSSVVPVIIYLANANEGLPWSLLSVAISSNRAFNQITRSSSPKAYTRTSRRVIEQVSHGTSREIRRAWHILQR